MNIFIPISKIDEEKRLVYGTLCAETPDKSGEILDYDSAVPAFKAWSDEIHAASQGKSFGNVRAMHGNVAAGRLTEIAYDGAAKAVHGVAHVVDDAEWAKCKAGVYTGFSIGGGYARRWPDPSDPEMTRYTPTLSEVSLVDNPCVPTATFAAVKSDGTVEMRKFKSINPKTVEEAGKTMSKKTEIKKGDALFAQVWTAPDGTTHESLNKADSYWKAKQAGEGPAAKAADAAVAELKSALAKAGAEGVSTLEGDDVKAGAKNSDNAKPGEAGEEPPSEPGEMSELNGDDLKDGAKNSSNAHPGEAGEVPPSEADGDTELDGDKGRDAAQSDNASWKVRKKDYSKEKRAEMADKGHAMPDGSFPIADKEDLEDAIQAHGRAKDKDAVKDHIKARAKDMGAEHMLPEKWSGKKGDKAAKKAERAFDMAKGLYEVAETAHVLQSLEHMHSRIEAEQLMEGDTTSDQAEKLKAWIAQGVAMLHDMVEEETSELFDGAEEQDLLDAALEDHEEMLMVAKSSPLETLGRFVKGNLVGAGLAKGGDMRLVRAAAAMLKAGARHSKKDMATIQAVHDKLHECRKSMVDLGASESHMEDNLAAGQGDNNQKSQTLRELRKVTSALETSELQKQALEGKLEGLAGQVTEMAALVKTIAKQPQPAKGRLRALSKGEDEGGSPVSEAELDKMVADRMAGMSEHEVSVALVKAARSRPVK